MKKCQYISLCIAIGFVALTSKVHSADYISSYYHDSYVYNANGTAAWWFEGTNEKSSAGAAATGWQSVYNGIITVTTWLPVGIVAQQTFVEYTLQETLRAEDSITYANDSTAAAGAEIWLLIDEYGDDPVNGNPPLLDSNTVIGPGNGAIGVGNRATISAPSQSKVQGVSAAVDSGMFSGG